MSKLLGKRCQRAGKKVPKEPSEFKGEPPAKIQKTEKASAAAKPGAIDLMLAETIEKVN